jgi:(S)-ureidoglycine aminohydrolase
MTRGFSDPFYTLLTPSNQYASRLAGLRDVSVVKLVTPRLQPSRFGQYLLDIAAGGGTARPVAAGHEHFLFGLEGEAVVRAGDGQHPIGAGGFAYLPDDVSFELTSDDEGARVLWLKRPYEPAGDGSRPGLRSGHRDEVPATPTPVPGLTRQELLDPEDEAFDFNMSLLRFEPGVALDRVEIHDEEHGLYMTAGAGLYRLGQRRHDVHAGDFIYMAPYCPQSFVASSMGPAEYLLYKDVYRDGF